MDSSSSSSSPEISLATFTETQQSRFSYKNASHEEVLEDLSRSTTFGPPLERSHFLFQPVHSQSPRSWAFYTRAGIVSSGTSVRPTLSLLFIGFSVHPLSHWFYEDFIREENPKFPSLPLKRFSAMLFEACPVLYQWSHDHEQAFNKFLQYKTRVPVCGAIMLNDAMDKVFPVFYFVSFNRPSVS